MRLKATISTILAAVLAVGMTACQSSPKKENTTPDKPVNIAAMKGPTAMGLVKYTDDLEKNEDKSVHYEIKTMPEDVVNGLMKGELDLACVPSNLAATLYNKSEGKIQIAAINTLNALYLASNNAEIKSLEDLKGKTIYATGKGATPEATLSTILEEADLEIGKDVNVEFKSEATEVAAVLTAEEGSIAFLPEPFLTTVTSKNENVKIIFTARDLWKDVVDEDEEITTGVLAVRKAFAEENEAWFKQFLNDYKASAEWVKANPDAAAELIGKQEIVPAPVAKKALPNIGITFITGEAMEDLVEEYLEVLCDFNPKLVGGKVPEDDFYYGAD